MDFGLWFWKLGVKRKDAGIEFWFGLFGLRI